MTTFETIADLMATRAPGLSTGLPQLDRVAPLVPGRVAVLIGASGVGKSRVATHIANTVECTHERGVLTVTSPITLDALDSRLAFQPPALVVVDPLTALTSPADTAGGEYEALTEQHPVHPAELGRLGEKLRALAHRHAVPLLLCHRYTPVRDSVTGQIVSTEAANPLLDQVDLVAVVRVLADPQKVGLEILRNRHGETPVLRVPLPIQDDTAEDTGFAAAFVPVPRMPLPRP